MVDFVWEWIVHGLRISFGWMMCANALNPRVQMVVGRTKPVGLVLLIAQGWRRKEPTLGKVAGENLCHRHCTFLNLFACGRSFIRRVW